MNLSNTWTRSLPEQFKVAIKTGELPTHVVARVNDRCERQLLVGGGTALSQCGFVDLQLHDFNLSALAHIGLPHAVVAVLHVFLGLELRIHVAEEALLTLENIFDCG